MCKLTDCLGCTVTSDQVVFTEGHLLKEHGISEVREWNSTKGSPKVTLIQYYCFYCHRGLSDHSHYWTTRQLITEIKREISP